MKIRNTNTNVAMPSQKGQNVYLVKIDVGRVSSEYVGDTVAADKIVVAGKNAKKLIITYNIGAASKRRANRVANSVLITDSSEEI